MGKMVVSSVFLINFAFNVSYFLHEALDKLRANSPKNLQKWLHGYLQNSSILFVRGVSMKGCDSETFGVLRLAVIERVIGITLLVVQCTRGRGEHKQLFSFLLIGLIW